MIWAVCGALSLIGAFCYAELGIFCFLLHLTQQFLLFIESEMLKVTYDFPGTMFPSAGGAYTYLYESFGPAVAFMYLWVTIIVGV